MKIYKVFLVVLSAALLLTTTCSSSGEASPNLITNGTASEGMRGWIDPDGLWQTSTNYDGVKEYDSYYFHPKIQGLERHTYLSGCKYKQL